MPVARFYLRMSSKKQENSLSAQSLELRTWFEALRKDDKPTEDDWYYDAAVVGDRPFNKRPDGERLLRDARKGDWVIFIKVDRMGRNTLDTLTTVQKLIDRGCRIFILNFYNAEYDSSSPLSQLMLTILSGIAQMERSQISERTRAVVKVLRAQGRALGGKVPMGSREVQRIDEATGKLRKYWVPNPAEKAHMEMLYREFKSGVPLREMVRLLRRRHVRHPRTGRWWCFTELQGHMSRMEKNRAEEAALQDMREQQRSEKSSKLVG